MKPKGYTVLNFLDGTFELVHDLDEEEARDMLNKSGLQDKDTYKEKRNELQNYYIIKDGGSMEF